MEKPTEVAPITDDEHVHCPRSLPMLQFGMAVIRNNAQRTTVDVDVLSSHEGWGRLSKTVHEGFAFHPDWAEDRANGIEINVVFPGDDWEMTIPYPQPEDVRE